MTVTQPTSSTREFLRIQAAVNAALRKSLKGTTKKQRQLAISRASVMQMRREG